jgi:hypothetical protein
LDGSPCEVTYSASNHIFTGGPVKAINVQTSGFLSNSVTGVGIYFQTNNTASNGSIFLDPVGKMWLRTNGTWIVK